MALRILTWNLGLGALGRGADLYPESWRLWPPSSQDQVRANLGLIAEVLVDAKADVILLQEVARGGILSRGVDLFAGLQEALPGHAGHFEGEVAFGFPFAHLQPRIGNALFCAREGARLSARDIGLPDSHLAPFVRKSQRLVSACFKLGVQEVEICGLHLDPYSGDPDVKHANVRQTLAAVQDRPVILGGDWNLLLQDLDLPHSYPAERLSWAVPFPTDALPRGWRLISPPGVATNRTLERAYAPGQNYLSALDGFVVSEEWRVLDAQTQDLGFEASDHNPVILDVELLAAASA